MSARETLIRSVYALKAMSQNDMEKLVDAYAHELAEKIRDHIGTADHPYESQRVKDLVAFGRAMANLIDPEVEK